MDSFVFRSHLSQQAVVDWLVYYWPFPDDFKDVSLA